MSSTLAEFASKYSSTKQDYAAVARLIAGADAPEWLADYLRHWAPSVTIDTRVYLAQPSRQRMKQFLAKISRHAKSLNEILNQPAVSEFLAGGSPSNVTLGHDLTLRDIAMRADWALASDAIRKRGRGRAHLDAAIEPKMFCAIIVVQAWTFVRGPSALRAKALEQAINCFWELCGFNPTPGWGANSGSGWRPYIKRLDSPANEEIRAECRRHLTMYKGMEGN